MRKMTATLRYSRNEFPIPDSVAARIAALLKQRIDEGKTGINASEGFYSYR